MNGQRNTGGDRDRRQPQRRTRFSVDITASGEWVPHQSICLTEISHDVAQILADLIVPARPFMAAVDIAAGTGETE